MQTREIHSGGDVHCNWCHGRGCLVCAPERAKRAKEIVLHIQCSGEELDDVLAKVNGAVLRTTQVLIFASYHGTCKEIEELERIVSDADEDDGDTSDPPEIRAMHRELAELRERTRTSFTVDRIADIERRLAAHKDGVESIKRLFAAEPPPEPDPEPPEWLKRKPRKKRAPKKSAH